MDIKPNRMVSLGYGRYWRSDGIVGLTRIEENRGPGRRTEVFTSTLDEPMVVSRSETAILQDMAVASDETVHIQEVVETLNDLAAALADIPDVMTRMLSSEAGFEVRAWQKRIRSLVHLDPDSPTPQSDLFD